MSRVHVVLIRPIYPRNVGMCARAMANMGVSDLVIVAPRADLGCEEAKQGAANAQAVLASARVYHDLESFFAKEGEGVRIALSGRSGTLMAASRLDEHRKVLASDSPLYLFFGPEDDGLANEETRLCHHICSLPTYGEITSLNLSHAVLLTLYMVRAEREARPSAATSEEAEVSDGQALYYPSESIHRWLEALGFDLSARRVSIEKTLNRIFLGNIPKPNDLRLLDSVLQQTIRKLKDR